MPLTCTWWSTPKCLMHWSDERCCTDFALCSLLATPITCTYWTIYFHCMISTHHTLNLFVRWFQSINPHLVVTVTLIWFTRLFLSFSQIVTIHLYFFHLLFSCLLFSLWLAIFSLNCLMYIINKWVWLYISGLWLIIMHTVTHKCSHTTHNIKSLLVFLEQQHFQKTMSLCRSAVHVGSETAWCHAIVMAECWRLIWRLMTWPLTNKLFYYHKLSIPPLPRFTI